jgi:drug/metabolite transporter (DMT)-like permease
MRFFWSCIMTVGLIGALADLAVNKWSQTWSVQWWAAGACGYLLFMTGFGLVLRVGAGHGYPLTVAVVLMLLINIGFVAGWDVLLLGTSLTAYQWFGVLLATGAVACFELGASK